MKFNFLENVRKECSKIFSSASKWLPPPPTTRPTPQWVPRTEIPTQLYIIYIYIYFFYIRQRTCYNIDDYSIFRVNFEISIQCLTSTAAPIHMQTNRKKNKRSSQFTSIIDILYTHQRRENFSWGGAESINGRRVNMVAAQAVPWV